MNTRRRPRRGGFTLVELLVAIGIALALLGIAIAVSQSSLFDSYKVVGAGDRVSQWLVTARGKAARDRAPRGLRFLVNQPATPGDLRQLATECVYIEQPEAWRPTPGAGLVVDYLWHPDTRTNPTLPEPKYGYKRIWVSNGTLGDFDYYPQASRPSVLTTPKVRPGDTVFVPNLGSFKIAQITVVGNEPMIAQPTAAPLPTAVVPTTPGDSPTAPATANPSAALAAFQLFLSDPVTLGGGDGAPSGGSPPMPGAPTDPTGYMRDQVFALPDLGAAHGQTNAGVRTAALRFDEHSFGITRQAQPLAGDSTLQLASGMAVDLTQNRSLTPVVTVQTSNVYPDPVNRYLDILFSPSGEVIQSGGTAGLMVLLVRDTNRFDRVLSLTGPTAAAEVGEAGEMVLVCIYTKTGAVATHPVAPPPTTDPYQFAKDGINTGL